MNAKEIETGVQVAQVALPLAEQLVNFLVGLFHHHAPEATPEQIQGFTDAATQAVADHSAAVAKEAVDAIPPKADSAPQAVTGVVFHGSTPFPR